MKKDDTRKIESAQREGSMQPFKRGSYNVALIIRENQRTVGWHIDSKVGMPEQTRSLCAEKHLGTSRVPSQNPHRQPGRSARVRLRRGSLIKQTLTCGPMEERYQALRRIEK